MDWGMQNRISRIIPRETGRAVMLAVDHGYFQGPTSGLERPGETVAPLLPYADSLMLTRGVLRQCVDASQRVPRGFSGSPKGTGFAPGRNQVGFLSFPPIT